MVEAMDAVETARRHVLAALDKGSAPDNRDTADFRLRLDALPMGPELLQP